MTRMMTMLLIALAGCGNVRRSDPPDGGTASDAMLGAPDAELQGCRAASAYGVPSVVDQAANHSNPPDVYALGGSLDGSADELQLQLYAGFGVFAGGVAPGTYDIAGDETQFATCGACALIFAERTPDMTLEDPDRIYLATSGTVEITSVTPDLSGSVSNLVLDHVTMDPGFTSTVVGDCQTTIDQLVFDAPVVENALVGTPLALTLRRK